MTRVSWMFVLGLGLIGSPSFGQEAGPAGDPDKGAAVFKKCMACHQVGKTAKNSTGPVLNGIVDRPSGTYPDYNYSKATKNSGLVWDESTLTRYLRAPREVIPGTRMAFAGLKKDQEIRDVVAYLREFDATGKRAAP